MTISESTVTDERFEEILEAIGEAFVMSHEPELIDEYTTPLQANEWAAWKWCESMDLIDNGDRAHRNITATVDREVRLNPEYPDPVARAITRKSARIRARRVRVQSRHDDDD
jgi:hypothetical protein